MVFDKIIDFILFDVILFCFFKYVGDLDEIINVVCFRFGIVILLVEEFVREKFSKVVSFFDVVVIIGILFFFFCCL